MCQNIRNFSQLTDIDTSDKLKVEVQSPLDCIAVINKTKVESVVLLDLFSEIDIFIMNKSDNAAQIKILINDICIEDSVNAHDVWKLFIPSNCYLWHFTTSSLGWIA
jgi:hypothetical protein